MQPQVTHKAVLSQRPMREWWPMPSMCPQEANESDRLTQTQRHSADMRTTGSKTGWFLLGLVPRIGAKVPGEALAAERTEAQNSPGLVQGHMVPLVK